MPADIFNKNRSQQQPVPLTGPGLKFICVDR